MTLHNNSNKLYHFKENEDVHDDNDTLNWIQSQLSVKIKTNLTELYIQVIFLQFR